MNNDTEKCQHEWVLEQLSKNGKFPGKCKKCGEEKNYGDNPGSMGGGKLFYRPGSFRPPAKP